MALQLYINGVDLTSWLMTGSCTISRPLGGRATCALNLDDRQRGVAITLNMPVIVLDGATKYFAGVIRSIVTTAVPDGVHLNKRFAIRALDYHSIFDRRRTSYYTYSASPAWTLQDIALDLIERHADLEGVTAPGLPTGPTFLEPITVNYNSLTEAMNTLSNASTAYGEPFLWWVDFEKVLHFSQFTSNPAPFSLTDTSNNFFDIEMEDTLDNYRNVQHVRTEHQIDATFVQSFTGNGSRTTFHTHHAIRDTPTVTVNAVSKTIGEQGVNETGKDFYWRRDEDGVFNQDHAVLSGAQTLAVTYVPTPRNIATVDNPAGMALYGPFEAVDEQRNIPTFPEAMARAEGVLNQADEPPRKMRFKVRDPALEPGHRITINLTRFSVNAEFLVEDINYRWVHAKTDFLELSVRATSLERAAPAKTAWLERLVELSRIGSPITAILGVGRPRIRTVDLHNLAVGNDIAPRVTVFATGTARRFTGVLRTAISADLTVRVKRNGTAIITMTIPLATAVGVVVESTSFVSTPEPLADGDVISWDITASDGSANPNGVATCTLEWTAE